MIIERIRREPVGGKSTLPARLREESDSRGLSVTDREALLAIVPPPLLACESFHDKLTGLWRYEFGEPHRVRDELVWGTHMWSPVPVLLDVLACARRRLPPQKLAAYLALLGNPGKHQEYLAEMFPMFRVDAAIPAEHEAGSMGAGNRTIDWLVGPVNGRRVLFDVKRRIVDFIAMMDGLSADEAAAPGHDVGLLFRSVEGKFRHSNPDQLLQGAWIVTDLKQDGAPGQDRSAFSRRGARARADRALAAGGAWRRLRRAGCGKSAFCDPRRYRSRRACDHASAGRPSVPASAVSGRSKHAFCFRPGTATIVVERASSRDILSEPSPM